MQRDEQSGNDQGDVPAVNPDGKRRRGRPPKLREVAMENQNQGFSMEQVMQLIAQNNQQNQQAMMEAIKELKKPSEEDQRKLDEEKQRRMLRAENAVKQAKIAEQQKENIRKGCAHGTYHPGTGAFTHQWRAQIHSPHGEKPYFVPRCTQCGTTINGRIYATAEQLQNGVNLDQYKGIDYERLQKWADESMKQDLVAS